MVLLRPIIPILAGVVFALLAAWGRWDVFADAELATTVPTVVQVSASMMGFMLAALAILISIVDKPLVQNLQKSGHYKDLLNTLFIASVIFAAIFVLSSVVLIAPVAVPHWKTVLLGLLFSGTFVLLQTGWKFWLVLSNLSPVE